jgi:hypothetical protein
MRAGGAKAGKCGITSDGGSAHLPLFSVYVGEEVLDTHPIGNAFEGPDVESCEDAIHLANAGAGVFCLHGNDDGDRVNFDMSCKLLPAEGGGTHTVLGTDDGAGSSRISVLVNGLGATPLEERFILFRRTLQFLFGRGISVVQPLVKTISSQWRWPEHPSRCTGSTWNQKRFLWRRRPDLWKPFQPLPCKIGRAPVLTENSSKAHAPGMLALALLLDGGELPKCTVASTPTAAPRTAPPDRWNDGKSGFFHPLTFSLHATSGPVLVLC